VALLAFALSACGGGGGKPDGGHTVSGSISPASAGAGATVTLGTKSASADASGAFSFTDVADGTYTATPAKAGVTFTPASQSLTVHGADVAGVAFTAQGSESAGTASVSGTVHAAGDQLVDSDTADINASSRSNNDPSTAQAVPSAATVGGHASETTDAVDAFRGSFAAGEIVNLAIADPEDGDLDLYLFTAADTDTPIAGSMGTGDTETVTIPEGGDYFIVVAASSGATNYVLSIGASPIPGAATRLRLDSEFVPGEVVVQFNEAALTPASAHGDELGARASSLGLVPLAGATRGRPALLGLGSTAAAHASALATLGVARDAPGPFGAPLDATIAAKRETLLAVKALRTRADIRSADPNYIHHASAVPNDKLYGYQWDLPLINLPQAWDVTTGAPRSGSVVVAVIDTGVFLAHPDLAGRLISGYDFISSATRSRDGDGIDADPDDPGDAAAAGSSSWHGTHVAGTIGARSNDGNGITGISWGAKIMPVRVLGVGGGTGYDIIQGVRYAAGLPNDSGSVPPQPADIANLSLGCQSCFSQAAQDAYSAARAAGMIVVAAAGNESSTEPGFPASYDGVISVSAVTLSGARAPYSNSGPTIDIAAPGGDTSVDTDGNGYVDGILSTLVDDSSGTREPAYVFYQGTSMASPHVAGVIALMKAVCPSLTPAQVDTLIAGGQMTTDLGAPGRDDVFGYGLIDAFGAVQAAQSQCGTMPATGLDVSPGRLDFGSVTAKAGLTTTRQGTGTLRIVGATADARWLSIAAGAVDAEGLGSYTASVDRTGLATGRYTGSIRFSLEGGANVVVPVSMQVGEAAATTGDAGYLYVLLIDSSSGRTVAATQGRSSGGTFAYRFTGVPAGDYVVAAGTDFDNDDHVCDPGEVCGAWPTLGAPTALSVAGADRTGIDFVVGFPVSLPNAASASSPPTGYRRRSDLKTILGASSR